MTSFDVIGSNNNTNITLDSNNSSIINNNYSLVENNLSKMVIKDTSNNNQNYYLPFSSQIYIKNQKYTDASNIIFSNISNVWSKITQRNNLEVAHPYIMTHRHEDTSFNLGHRDTIEYINNTIISRTIIQWEDKVGFRFMNRQLNTTTGLNSIVSWYLDKIEDNKTKLTIRIWADTDEITIDSINPFLKTYLEAVIRGFKEWIETGSIDKYSYEPHPFFGGYEGIKSYKSLNISSGVCIC